MLAVQIGMDELVGICLKKALVTGISRHKFNQYGSYQYVKVRFDTEKPTYAKGPEFDNVPVFIHTNEGAREMYLKARATGEFNTASQSAVMTSLLPFKNAALLFPFSPKFTDPKDEWESGAQVHVACRRVKKGESFSQSHIIGVVGVEQNKPLDISVDPLSSAWPTTRLIFTVGVRITKTGSPDARYTVMYDVIGKKRFKIPSKLADGTPTLPIIEVATNISESLKISSFFLANRAIAPAYSSMTGFGGRIYGEPLRRVPVGPIVDGQVPLTAVTHKDGTVYNPGGYSIDSSSDPYTSSSSWSYLAYGSSGGENQWVADRYWLYGREYIFLSTSNFYSTPVKCDAEGEVCSRYEIVKGMLHAFHFEVDIVWSQSGSGSSDYWNALGTSHESDMLEISDMNSSVTITYSRITGYETASQSSQIQNVVSKSTSCGYVSSLNQTVASGSYLSEVEQLGQQAIGPNNFYTAVFDYKKVQELDYTDNGALLAEWLLAGFAGDENSLADESHGQWIVDDIKSLAETKRSEMGTDAQIASISMGAIVYLYSVEDEMFIDAHS